LVPYCADVAENQTPPVMVGMVADTATFNEPMLAINGRTYDNEANPDDICAEAIETSAENLAVPTFNEAADRDVVKNPVAPDIVPKLR
jgi:hypothetical protein